ncbi:MAG: hypothetical protein J5J06_15730 [Phycisphaerae bacterium]|nr:hypothetical protein [Phycisphaerae bacterium]
MNDRLFFIPIVVNAFEQPDPKSALREAFDRITRIGPSRQTAGFRQFRRFMDEVAREYSRTGFTGESSVLDDVVASCVRRLTGSEGEPGVTQTPGDSGPSGDDEIYQTFCGGIRSAADRPSIREIIVERNGVVMAGFALGQDSDAYSIHDVTPGHYRLRLESGRVLWERTLTAEDLIWSVGFPEDPLPMAADSGEPDTEPAFQASLIGNRLILHVHPGLESGSIAITWKGQETRT